MEQWDLSISRNPLRTRKDLVESLASLIKPLLSRFVRGSTGLHIGNTSAHYDEVVALLEGESRLLWGLAPYAAGKLAEGGHCIEGETENAAIENVIKNIIQGLKTGPDPTSPWYWGVGTDRDQRYVEMAAIAFSLLLVPETFWEPLSSIQRQNLASWLAEINNVELPPTNWEFFRVLVNIALKKRGYSFDSSRLVSSLDAIEALYREDGWYIDETNFDLYNPFAFHFYGLVYAHIMEDEDPARAGRFRERARLFSRQFLPWFAENGSCIPFGRSLCYRFAVVSFFAACAFAGEEVLPRGVLKGIILRNLRWWFRRPIFDHEGLLTIGYGYPNLIMAEQYNAPGSPYWALKTYLLLALPEAHPFWTSKEEELPPQPEISHNTPPHLLICTKKDQGMKHTYLVNAGQYPCWESVHAAAKYAKFAYSAEFGFCVSHGAYDLSKTGCDSSLVLSEGDGYWRERRQSIDRFSCSEYVYSRWFPWPDVEIRTWILPFGFWNIRIHEIVSDRELETAEGGYSLPDNNALDAPVRPAISQSDVHGVFARFPWACGGIVDLVRNREAELHKPEPNLNILYPKVLIPLLRGRTPKGKTLLACGAFAARTDTDANAEAMWNEVPNLVWDQRSQRFIVEFEGKRIIVDVECSEGSR